MFRCLIRNFQKSLVLTPTLNSDLNLQFTKILACAFTTNAIPPQICKPQHENPLDSDEYIVPYRSDRESRSKNNSYVIETLRTKYCLSDTDIQKILSDEAVHRRYKENFLSRSLEILCKYGLTKNTFLECPWLITMDPKRLELKLQDISSLQILDMNEIAPLLRLTLPRLNKLLKSLRRETKYIPHGNRIYYISEKLGLSVHVVTKYLSKRLFILEMPFDMLNQNLEHMLHYNVSPLNILRDLWAFRYTPKSVETRLKRAKLAKKDKIMPWMVRCPESILQRSFKLSLDERQILGEQNSAVDYIAKRLDFSVSDTRAILQKHPSVLKVRVTKIKEVLDYLLNEEHFTRHEIAQVPRILCHSLMTTKERLNELKAVGCRPSSLVIVCKSKREYGKFLDSWIKVKEKIQSAPTNATNQ